MDAWIYTSQVMFMSTATIFRCRAARPQASHPVNIEVQRLTADRAAFRASPDRPGASVPSIRAVTSRTRAALSVHASGRTRPVASAAVQVDGTWGREATVRALRKLAGAATGATGEGVLEGSDPVGLAALPGGDAVTAAFGAIAERRRVRFGG